MLAFDLEEPWSCHQTRKVFDEKYNDIFGRPGVNAQRIIFLHEIIRIIQIHKEKITNAPFASYGLTAYIILAAVKKLLEQDILGKALCQNPKNCLRKNKLDLINDFLKSMVIGINHELRYGQMANYKSKLKNRTNVLKLLNGLIQNYQKDRSRNKIDDIGVRLAKCKTSV